MARFSVTCPHCHALLELDAERELVVDSKPAERPKGPTTTIEDRLTALARERTDAESKMAEALRAEKAGAELREEKFRRLLDGAKDQPIEKPIRDIDID